MPYVDRLPKVTPYLLDRADTMCPRRLRCAYQDHKGTDAPFLRWRIRDPLVEDARAAHHDLGPPNPAAFTDRESLVPEERALLGLAQRTYLRLFADEPARAIDHEPYERPYESSRRGVRVGGGVDLAVEGPNGERELRQFELWGRTPCADPFASAQILCAVLRLSGWVGKETLRIRHADLIGGWIDEYTVDLGATLGDLAQRFDHLHRMIQQRSAEPAPPVPGQECAQCSYMLGCEAHA